MIYANKLPIKPTIFPDGTSQIWKLPEELINGYEINVEWLFEDERELFWLMSLRRLLYSHPMSLYVPYLPYARQDKEVSNFQTFNLEVLADCLNAMRLSSVKSYDVHNCGRCNQLIKNFENIRPELWHKELIAKISPDLIVSPDSGAAQRYGRLGATVYLEKQRNQLTGLLKVWAEESSVKKIAAAKTVLILDDICDAGGTFLLAAEEIRRYGDPKIHLGVSHGLYTAGKKIFKEAKITLHSRHDWHEKRSTVN